MQKKLRNCQPKRLLIRTKSQLQNMAFLENEVSEAMFTNNQGYAERAFRINLERNNPLLAQLVRNQIIYDRLCSFQHGVGNNQSLREAADRGGTNPQLRSLRVQSSRMARATQNEQQELYDMSRNNGDLASRTNAVAAVVGDRVYQGMHLVDQISTWCQSERYRLGHNSLTPMAPGDQYFHFGYDSLTRSTQIPINRPDRNISSESLEAEQQVIQEVVEQPVEQDQQQAEQQDQQQDQQQGTGVLSDTSSTNSEISSTPLVFSSFSQQPHIDLEVQLAICKLIPILRSSAKNPDLFLQPKLVLKKNYIGAKIDLHKGTDIQPSVLVNYKQFIVGLKNYQSQPYIIVGKNLSMKNIPMNLQIKGCFPLTGNKAKLVKNFEGNVNAIQNLEIQKPLNAPFIQNMGLNGESSINLLSFSKSSSKLFSSAKNQIESKKGFSKASFKENFKVEENIKPTMFASTGINLNNPEDKNFGNENEFHVPATTSKYSLNHTNYNTKDFHVQTVSITPPGYNNFSHHKNKNSAGFIVLFPVVSLATSLFFIHFYRLIEKRFFSSYNDTI